MCILNKATLTTENRSTVLYNFFLLDMFMFNELVIKNDPVEKATLFFVFIEEFQVPHDQVLVLKNGIFHRNVSGKLYRNSKSNILANLTLFNQPHKNLRVSRSLVKGVQGFGQFSHKYFKP